MDEIIVRFDFRRDVKPVVLEIVNPKKKPKTHVKRTIKI